MTIRPWKTGKTGNAMTNKGENMVTETIEQSSCQEGVFEFYGNQLSGPEYLASVFTLVGERKCPFCKKRVNVTANGESRHPGRCKSNPANCGKGHDRMVTLSPANHAVPKPFSIFED